MPETSKSTKYLKGEWCGCADMHLYSVNTHLSVRRVKVFSRSAPSREVRNHGSRVSCRCILFSGIVPTQPSSLRLVLSPSPQPHFSRLGLLPLSPGHHRRPGLDPLLLSLFLVFFPLLLPSPNIMPPSDPFCSHR